jgi:AhpD family alkylhydroperoxidase
MGRGAVERRVKELAYLAVSFINHCPYCLADHRVGGRKAGISEAEMAAVEQEDDSGFSRAEQAALSYARELTRKAMAPQSRPLLDGYFTQEQVVELTLVVAMANFTNRFNNGLGILPE